MSLSGERRLAVERLRGAVSELFGAERRLRVRDHSRAGQLTVVQIRALAALGREREMTAGQLARSADLGPASVTALLDQLEALGVVERRRSHDDRRVYIVSLTDAGAALLEEKLTHWDALWEERLAGISDEQIDIAARVTAELAVLYSELGPRLDAPLAQSS